MTIISVWTLIDEVILFLQELILDTLHYCMTIETHSALERGGMENFTKLLGHESAVVRGKAARDIMDLRQVNDVELSL